MITTHDNGAPLFATHYPDAAFEIGEDIGAVTLTVEGVPEEAMARIKAGWSRTCWRAWRWRSSLATLK